MKIQPFTNIYISSTHTVLSNTFFRCYIPYDFFAGLSYILDIPLAYYFHLSWRTSACIQVIISTFSGKTGFCLENFGLYESQIEFSVMILGGPQECCLQVNDHFNGWQWHNMQHLPLVTMRIFEQKINQNLGGYEDEWDGV